MHVRDDLLTDMVNTLYKDEARIKQLEAALSLAIETAKSDICGHWDEVLPYLVSQLQALKE